MTSQGGRRRRPVRKRVRTPTLIQMEAAECGAASLGIILAHYGKHVPLEELRQVCGVSRDGSTASSILKAARRYGLTAKGAQCEVGHLRLPAIIHWRFAHFLVLEGMGNRKVRLNDPALGPRAVSWDEFDRSYTGVAIELEPGPDFRREGRKFSLVAAMARRWRGLGSVVSLTILLGLIVAAVGIAVPTASRVFVDRVLLGGATDVATGVVLALAAATVMTFVASAVQRMLLVRAQTAMVLGSTAQIVRHMLRLPQSFFDTRLAPDLTHRLDTNDAVADVLTRRLASILVDLLLVLVYGFLVCTYDLVLGLCAAGFAGINVVVLRWLGSMRVAAVAGLQAERGKWYSVVHSTIATIETTKASGQEEFAFGQFASRQAAVTSGQQRAGVPVAVLSVVPPLLMAVSTGVLLVVGGHLVMSGELTMGALVAVLVLVAAMNRPINDLSEVSSQVLEIGVDLQRLEDVERYPLPPPGARVISDEPLQGHLVVDSVSFGYNPLSPALLVDFSLELPPGTRVALVGGSGSGKSTVGRLVTGLCRPWSGSITIDGHDLADLDPGLLAATVAMVGQDMSMFEGTVRDNVVLWDETIGDDEVVAALQAAHVHRDVAARPGGIESQVREGGRNFSGGQRQRLEIARALVRGPRLLVLDEATSALDPETERLVDENLRRTGATCLIIAHRLSTVRDCDLIVVLRHGREVERGTHDELLARNGAYAELVRHNDTGETT